MKGLHEVLRQEGGQNEEFPRPPVGNAWKGPQRNVKNRLKREWARKMWISHKLFCLSLETINAFCEHFDTKTRVVKEECGK